MASEYVEVSVDVDIPIDLKCKHCGAEVHIPKGERSRNWNTQPEVIGWCRFQLCKDFEHVTPWFCCTNHMIAWLNEHKLACNPASAVA